jgi:RecA/RadA recombinase
MPKKTVKKDEAPKKAATKAAKTTKKGIELSRKDKLMALQQNINSSFKGRATVLTGEEFSNVFILRRPTGITSLDIAIGGGFPAGGMTQIVGPESVGKDYLCNRVIANLQAIYGEDASVALAMTELSYDKKYAKKCGVSIALTQLEIEQWQQALGRPFTSEEMGWAQHQVGTFHQIMGTTAEDLLEAAARAIASNLYQVVVINSFGALLTKAEAESQEGVTAKFYGGASGPITSFMHRLHAALNMPDEDGNPNTTTVIGINQFRDNLGPDSRWNPLKIAGGWALKHGKLVDIYLQARSRIKIPMGTKQEIVGKEIHWEIIKGKAGCHDGPKGMYPFYFGEHGYPFGADVYQDLITVGVERGIIKQSASWLSYQEDGYDMSAQGKEKFAYSIAESPGAFDHLRDKIFKVANVSFINKEEGF